MADYGIIQAGDVVKFKHEAMVLNIESVDKRYHIVSEVMVHDNKTETLWFEDNSGCDAYWVDLVVSIKNIDKNGI